MGGWDVGQRKRSGFRLLYVALVGQGLRGSPWPRLILAGAAGALVLGSFLVPLWRAYSSRRSTAAERSHARGAADAPRIGMTITRGDRSWTGASGEIVFPGDRIQFTYSSKRDVQFALLHAGREKTVILFPNDGFPNDGDPTTVLIAAGEQLPLEPAIELDKRAGDERVFGLFCIAKLALEPVRTALQKTDGLPKLQGCEVDSLTLRRKLR
jgi:hypothetical protein